MNSVIKLRDYQQDTSEALFKSWASGMRRPAVVLPTGSGKTVIFSDVIRKFHRLHQERSIVLVHRDELADQAIEKITDWAPDLQVGKVKAHDNEVHCDVMVCSVQTISRDARLRRLGEDQRHFGNIGLIIIDECHHATAKSYKTIYEAFPHALHAGFTATLARGDGVGLGSVWEDVVFSRSVLWMISRGYLVDIVPMTVTLSQLDLNKVKKTGGDFQVAALGTAMVDAGSPMVVAGALRKYAPQRRSIVFCPDVFSAVATATAIGPTSAVVHGKTPREERKLIYKRFETGELRVIVNCMVLTEGFDAPWADCVVIARPTQSAPLFAQMAGRGLRTWPGKENCLLLDVAGTGGRLSTLIDLAPGEVGTIRPGESLADAAIRYETEQNTVYDADSLAFALKHREMDLFAGSSKAWLRTEGGVMFIPVGSGFVFLWADGNGAWDVGAAPARGRWRKLHTGLPLGTAQAWAETEADDLAPVGVMSGNKFSGWRKEEAGGPQLGRVRRYGYAVPENPTKGQISDLINIGEASLKLDPYMKGIK